MKIVYDQKEKIFTDHVTKVPFPVIIHTVHHTITGVIHLRPEDRLIDSLHTEGRYRAITNVVVLSESGEELYRSCFFAINLDHVIWMMPFEDMDDKPKFMGEA